MEFLLYVCIRTLQTSNIGSNLLSANVKWNA